MSSPTDKQIQSMVDTYHILIPMNTRSHSLYLAVKFELKGEYISKLEFKRRMALIEENLSRPSDISSIKQTI